MYLVMSADSTMVIAITEREREAHEKKERKAKKKPTRGNDDRLRSFFSVKQTLTHSMNFFV